MNYIKKQMYCVECHGRCDNDFSLSSDVCYVDVYIDSYSITLISLIVAKIRIKCLIKGDIMRNTYSSHN